MQESDTGTESPCNCKVGRVAEDRGLRGIHDDLERQWRAEDSASVRELAEEFNRQVLRAGIEISGRTPLDGEVENLYRVLTDDGVDAGSRTQARERLRQEGVPIREIEDQFLSHQTMYRHLVDCLEITRESTQVGGDSRVATWRDRILSLRTRMARVTERGIEQLRGSDAVDIGSFEVYIDVNVFCEDCDGFYTIEEFLDGRTCDCEPADDPSAGRP